MCCASQRTSESNPCSASAAHYLHFLHLVHPFYFQKKGDRPCAEKAMKSRDAPKKPLVLSPATSGCAVKAKPTRPRAKSSKRFKRSPTKRKTPSTSLPVNSRPPRLRFNQKSPDQKGATNGSLYL